ncbi:MAG: ATP-binding protein [Clostridium sp.]|uniref:ATP-binding protein n=1 Tax=Clostridium sp. DSM 8431 TaxID=1761781 RepID=UPI0008F3F35A|nr:ATP-binding protein [Clostridium sp. DSM 8431]MCR4943421.1 ATP-binding protein [Clostridium sp.]SFU79967.1 DNA replication protein DnaC [Clostridium sp. DSM 8431]
MINGYKSKLDSIYSKIREDEARNLQRRFEEIKNLSPEIVNLDNEIKKLSVHLSLAILKSNNPEKVVQEYKDKITDLRAEKCEMLVAKGYDPDYLSLHYQCNKCKDTGFINREPCSCYRQKLISLYYENSLLKDTVKNKNFDNFDMSLFSQHKIGDEKYSPRKNMENILNFILKEYLPKFDFIDTNLLFYGNPGSGKSYLSYCIAKALLDTGHLVVYKTSDELISDLRKIRFNNDKHLEELLTSCDLLIIDDLGAEQRNDFSITELFNLLNKRLLNNKKMLISTNLSLSDITKLYSERIYSRLIGDFKLCKFYSEDIRITLNLKKNNY